MGIKRRDECTKDGKEVPEARRVGGCMREKQFEDREEGECWDRRSAGGTNGVTIARR